MHRIVLEAAQYTENAFVTLTYCDTELPQLNIGTGEIGSTLEPKHLQDWLKRLRCAVAPRRVRYFAVGEYGDETWRPHYHAALFGYPPCAYGQSRYSLRTLDCCHWCDLVRDTWGKGHVYVGNLGAESAGYLAGYVTKKMTMRDDPRLRGRYPEFARMSLKPGIGADAMHEVADVVMRYNIGDNTGDVPSTLRHGMRELPLGRYLRKKLRVMVGKDEKAPATAMAEMEAELLPLRLAAKKDEKVPSFKAHLINANRGRVQSMEGKVKLFKKRRSL